VQAPAGNDKSTINMKIMELFLMSLSFIIGVCRL
jgi:hypothetical protein